MRKMKKRSENSTACQLMYFCMFLLECVACDHVHSCVCVRSQVSHTVTCILLLSSSYLLQLLFVIIFINPLHFYYHLRHLLPQNPPPSPPPRHLYLPSVSFPPQFFILSVPLFSLPNLIISSFYLSIFLYLALSIPLSLSSNFETLNPLLMHIL